MDYKEKNIAYAGSPPPSSSHQLITVFLEVVRRLRLKKKKSGGLDLHVLNYGNAARNGMGLKRRADRFLYRRRLTSGTAEPPPTGDVLLFPRPTEKNPGFSFSWPTLPCEEASAHVDASCPWQTSASDVVASRAKTMSKSIISPLAKPGGPRRRQRCLLTRSDAVHQVTSPGPKCRQTL